MVHGMNRLNEIAWLMNTSMSKSTSALPKNIGPTFCSLGFFNQHSLDEH